jgi:hypothetical protein
MTTYTVFHQLIDEIEQIRPSLQLKLPASSLSIRLQIGKITAAQERLRAIEERIYLFANRGIRPASRRNYLNLKSLVRNMIVDGNNFKLLAEEYFYDPEGVMIVLNDLKQREYELQAQLQQLKHQSIAQNQRMFALWQLKLRGNRVSQWIVQATN